MGSDSISNYDWINDVGGPDAEFNWALDGFNDLPNAGYKFDAISLDSSKAYSPLSAILAAMIVTALIHYLKWWPNLLPSINFSDECASVEIADGCGDFGGDLVNNSSRKRMRDESCTGLVSKASREKMRRDRLNDRFLELGTVLEPGRPPKSDKATILSDASRALIQLRTEAQQLKEANEKLQETIKDLKAEKNELRNEKINLKEEKDKLEEQVKAMSLPPVGLIPHPAAYHAAAAAAFAAQGQAAANKTATPFPGFPGAAMWQWMPPAVVDTSQDHKLRPPVA